MRELTLILHFLGLGLLVTTSVAGILLNRQYKKAPDLPTKAIILRAAKPIGLLSPVAMVLMLLTGIGNMHAIGVGIFTFGWLSAKLVFFMIAVVGGVLLGIASKKRGALVAAMAAGKAGDDAEKKVSAYDNQIGLGYVILPVLLLVILYLSVYGRLGGQ